MQDERSPSVPAAIAKRLRDGLGKAGFNPAEPRDERARWTRDENSRGAAAHLTVAYQGHFHDLVVDDFLDGLRSKGSSVLKNIRVLGLNGILAIPDGASKPAGENNPYFIEVKTGQICSLPKIRRRSIL